MPDPTPAIIEASNRFRRQALARERRAASAMVRYYGQTWRRLSSDIFRLRYEVEEQRAGGKRITQDQVRDLARMREIQRQAGEELLKFADFADTTITAGEREAIAAAERNSYDLIQAAFPADAEIAIDFARMPRAAVEQLAGQLADGSPLKDLLREAVGEAGDDFGARMVTGIAAGWNPRELAKELREAFGMGLTRALRISRTEQLRAYRTAALNTYKANDDVVKAWERHAAKDTRTCMACIMLDGTRYTLQEHMDDHVQGRCAMLPVTKTYKELGIDAPEPDFRRELASDWFRRQDETTQKAMMGQRAHAAWQDGKFRLEDIPKQIKNRIWGNSWTPKSLKELLGGAKPAIPGTFGSLTEAREWFEQRQIQLGRHWHTDDGEILASVAREYERLSGLGYENVVSKIDRDDGTPFQGTHFAGIITLNPDEIGKAAREWDDYMSGFGGLYGNKPFVDRPDIVQTFRHEFGHSVHPMLPIKYEYKGQTLNIADLVDQSLARGLASDEGRRNIARAWSSYATSNKAEYWAEVFTKLNDPNYTPTKADNWWLEIYRTVGFNQ